MSLSGNLVRRHGESQCHTFRIACLCWLCLVELQHCATQDRKTGRASYRGSVILLLVHRVFNVSEWKFGTKTWGVTVSYFQNRVSLLALSGRATTLHHTRS